MTASASGAGTSPQKQSLPFCELHVHLEGTLEPDAIFGLAERNRITLPYRDIDDLSTRYEFTDLQSFLNLYYDNLTVLRKEGDYFYLALRYLRRAHQGGVRHVEMFVDPQAHEARGVSTESVLRGVSAAISEAAAAFGMTAAIIVCVVRDMPVSSAMSMLDAVLATGIPVAGIGLDSAEVGYPPSLFREVFKTARDAGLRCVAHAGEEGPPEYIWQALDDLGAERIDHGVRCLEDGALVNRLARDRIPLTVCPLSNVRLGVVDELALLPLREMLERELLVTLNSDDPAYFGGYLDQNIRTCVDVFGFNFNDLTTLAANSIEASFASDERKLELKLELRL